MAVDYEEELAEDEEIEAETDERNMESESISVNADHADNDNCEIVNDENEEETQEQNEDDEIPNPEQVESSSMFTAEDTIRLHEAAQLEKGSKIGGASLTDESNSMYVNPDDTLSEMNGLSSATTTSNNNNTNNISTINEEPSTVQDEKLAVNSDKKDKSTENEQKEIQETNESESEEKEEPKREQGKENDEDKQEKVKSESKGPKQISTRSIAEKHPDNCIWVSGIPSTIKAADLKSLFSKHGRVVSAKVVKVKCKGSIQWYGNLVMSSAEETSNCITNLHRTELHGKSISVERTFSCYDLESVIFMFWEQSFFPCGMSKSELSGSSRI
uniref:RRM domain-containing protein n=1 Tax=Romanomermis culicivorax TaxID=13658 RepID=A0A915KTX3_ROMCU